MRYPNEAIRMQDVTLINWSDEWSRESAVIIYLLRDPRTGEPAYLGRSMKGLKSAIGHWRHDHIMGSKRPVNVWLVELMDEGLIPQVEVVEVLNDGWKRTHTTIEDNRLDGELRELERAHIKRFRRLGFDMKNVTDGGERGARREFKKRKQTKFGPKPDGGYYGVSTRRPRRDGSSRYRVTLYSGKFRRHEFVDGFEEAVELRKKWEAEARALGGVSPQHND